MDLLGLGLALHEKVVGRRIGIICSSPIRRAGLLLSDIPIPERLQRIDAAAYKDHEDLGARPHDCVVEGPFARQPVRQLVNQTTRETYMSYQSGPREKLSRRV